MTAPTAFAPHLPVDPAGHITVSVLCNRIPPIVSAKARKAADGRRRLIEFEVDGAVADHAMRRED